MHNREIINRNTGKIIFSGAFASFKECLEMAIRKQIDLSAADLTHTNLCHANLDDGLLNGADFTGSNLIGANLSEASLDCADFADCSLESACLAFSSLQNYNFTRARFGGTYIAGALIDGAQFSGNSCLNLDFIDTGSMADCVYRDEENREALFSAPPLLLHGLPKSIALIGDMIKIGPVLYKCSDLNSLNDPLLHHYRDVLRAIATSRKTTPERFAEAA